MKFLVKYQRKIEFFLFMVPTLYACYLIFDATKNWYSISLILIERTASDTNWLISTGYHLNQILYASIPFILWKIFFKYWVK